MYTDDPMKPSRLLVASLSASFIVLALSACSKTREPAVVTLPEFAPSTTVPSTLAPAPGGEGETPAPPAIEWVAQVGGAGDDSFSGLTSSRSSRADQGEGQALGGANLIAVGSTTGGITGPTHGAEDVLTARIAPDGEVLATDVIGSADVDVATSATAISTPGSSESGAASIPIGCGYTNGDFAGRVSGLLDGWCGPVDTGDPTATDHRDTGRLFGFSVVGFAAEANEVITGVAATSPEDDPSLAAQQHMYVVGSTDGMYPGAGDSTGRGLGQGDALAFRTFFGRGVSWIRQFGTPEPDAATAVCTVGGDGYFVGWTDGDLGGRSKGGRDAWISMIDRNGMQRWVIQFGYPANEEFRAIGDGGKPAEGTQQFVAVGVTDGDGPQPSNGAKDALIAAFAPDGSTLWAVQIGDKLDDEAAAVAVVDSTIYVAGTTTSRAATAESPAVDGLGELDDAIGPGGSKDAYLAAIDARTGAVQWTTRFGSAADELATSMTVTSDGLLAIAGSTTGALGKNTSAGGRDGFVVTFQLPSAGGGAQSWV